MGAIKEVQNLQISVIITLYQSNSPSKVHVITSSCNIILGKVHFDFLCLVLCADTLFMIQKYAYNTIWFVKCAETAPTVMFFYFY